LSASAKVRQLPFPENASPGFQKAIQTGRNVLENEDMVLHMPVKIRGQSIGAISYWKSPQEASRLTPETIAMADSTLHPIRRCTWRAHVLYQDISLRANTELAISEISNQDRQFR